MNLVEILKNVPIGTKLYSPIFGNVKLCEILDEYNNNGFAIKVSLWDGDTEMFTKEGKFFDIPNAECTLFPSKDNRDWSILEEDLLIDTPIMVSDDTIDWHFRYYAGNNQCWDGGYNSQDFVYKSHWKYIIPFDKFNASDTKESLKYNIVNN